MQCLVQPCFFILCMYLIAYRWRRLKAQMIEKRSKLGESQTLQQFSRDVDEIEAWVSEKLQTASDESYKDPTNIQVNMILSLGIKMRYLASQRILCFEGMCSVRENNAPCWTQSSFNKGKMEIALHVKRCPK